MRISDWSSYVCSSDLLSKSGTPTMGGALILSSIGISTVLWADLANRYVWVVLLVTLLFGAIGWVDDYRKVIEKNSRGLPSRWKYFWQSVFGLGAAVFLYMTAQTPVETTLILPLLKHIEITLGIDRKSTSMHSNHKCASCNTSSA